MNARRNDVLSLPLDDNAHGSARSVYLEKLEKASYERYALEHGGCLT